jgi:uncharacterized protein (TIGR02118 family)
MGTDVLRDRRRHHAGRDDRGRNEDPRAFAAAKVVQKWSLAEDRKAGMRPEEFHRYWKEQNWPLAKSVPEFFRYVRKYVQSYTLADPAAGFSGFEVPFDGFAELWFDSLEDVGKAFAEPCYLEIIRA